MSAREQFPFPYLPRMDSDLDRHAVEEWEKMCNHIDQLTKELDTLERRNEGFRVNNERWLSYGKWRVDDGATEGLALLTDLLGWGVEACYAMSHGEACEEAEDLFPRFSGSWTGICRKRVSDEILGRLRVHGGRVVDRAALDRCRV